MLIAVDEPLAGDLARRLSGACRPILVTGEGTPAVESSPSWRVVPG